MSATLGELKSSAIAKEPGIHMDIYEPVEMRRTLGRLGVDVNISALSVGDYQLSDEVCIERKTISDFLKSMYTGRLGYQLQLLGSSFHTPILLIEGVPEYHAGINLKSFYAYVSKLVLTSPIGILQTPNMSSSGILISLMSLKMGSSPSIPRMRPAKSLGQGEAAIQVLAQFPGIGPVLSWRLLEEFKSLRSIFKATEKAMGKVKGLGRGKIKNFFDLLDFEVE
jgi:Fanconi anemia group M protein